ncbi:MAG: DUF3231 family protein [Sporomusaceae bacterium]|nr:DUF3231 family protein [Sporomusaceae bacterium]
MRGQNISQKHIEVFSNLLKNDDLSAPATWDSEATDSTTAPFSDKLMMQQIISLIALSMTNYGVALGSSTRVDVAADYTRLMAESIIPIKSPREWTFFTIDYHFDRPDFIHTSQPWNGLAVPTYSLPSEDAKSFLIP